MFLSLFFFFFLPFQLASIFHPKHQAGGGSSAGRRQRSAEINGFLVGWDEDGVTGGDPRSPSLRWGTGGAGSHPAEGRRGAIALPSQEDLTDGASQALSLSKHTGEASPRKIPPS